MSSHPPSEAADQADALLCRAAARLLEARRRSSAQGTCPEPDVARVMTAMGEWLDADPGSVPDTVRSAVVLLAEHLSTRFAIPAPGRPDAGTTASRQRGLAATDRRPSHGFARSIRLGRMG